MESNNTEEQTKITIYRVQIVLIQQPIEVGKEMFEKKITQIHTNIKSSNINNKKSIIV